MQVVIMCEVEDCAYRIDGSCSKSIICITPKTFSGFASGKREWSPACEDYKETDNELCD